MSTAQYKKPGNIRNFYPTASADIEQGDLLMLNHQAGTCKPMATALKVRANEMKLCGFADDKWNQAIALTITGKVAGYSSPSSYDNTKMRCITRGIFHLAISDTSGSAGQPVWYISGGTGAQIFSISKPDAGACEMVIGELADDFSGATANDKQMVLIDPTVFDQKAAALMFWMRNHVEQGLLVGFDTTSHVSYTKGIAYVDGKSYSIAYASAALATGCASHTGRRCVLYVINASGAAAAVTTTENTFTTTAATATAMQDSAFWPTTSLLPFAVGYLGSESTDLNAGAVKSVRRTVNDLIYQYDV